MTNLPTNTEGPIVPVRNPEEFAAMLQAHTWLARICADHRKELEYVREATNEADDQFLWGQDFETEPEVWDFEDWADLTDEGYDDLRGLGFL